MRHDRSAVALAGRPRLMLLLLLLLLLLLVLLLLLLLLLQVLLKHCAAVTGAVAGDRAVRAGAGCGCVASGPTHSETTASANCCCCRVTAAERAVCEGKLRQDASGSSAA